MDLLSDLRSDLTRLTKNSALSYKKCWPKIRSAGKILLLAEEQGGWVSAEEYLDAYDARAYNPENRQCDIKIIKRHDYEGGYVLWNRTKDVYHTGVGSDVLKKVERHFRGYGNKAVYADWEKGDVFSVTLYRLSSTEYDTLQDLGRSLRCVFGEYPLQVANPEESVASGSEAQSYLPVVKKAALVIFVLVVCCWMMRLS